MSSKKVKKPNPDIWKQITTAWGKACSPSRPSLGDIKIYGKFILQSIGKKKNCRVLILGATPELRSLILKYGLSKKIDLFLLDLNLEMIRAMDEFIEIPNSKEKRVIGDWLSMPFKNEYFDLVLGDEVLINVSLTNRNKFLMEINRVLKSSGAFITRASHENPLAKKFTLEKALNKYSNYYLQNKLKFNQAVNYVLEEIFQNSYFKNPKGLLSLKFLEKDCYKALKSPSPLKRLIIKTILDDYSSLFKQSWSWESRPQQLKKFKEYFQIKEIETARDYLYSYILPIYYLIKK
ncbi:MAG: methyltransferase domain-containing protein [Patescibacteria group bacterium]|jgi:ubiquinone/menaquinone biosynthesis C-methylase UbiE